MVKDATFEDFRNNNNKSEAHHLQPFGVVKYCRMVCIHNDNAMGIIFLLFVHNVFVLYTLAIFVSEFKENVL